VRPPEAFFASSARPFRTIASRRSEVRGQLAAGASSGDPAVVSGDASAGERSSRVAIVSIAVLEAGWSGTCLCIVTVGPAEIRVRLLAISRSRDAFAQTFAFSVRHNSRPRRRCDSVRSRATVTPGSEDASAIPDSGSGPIVLSILRSSTQKRECPRFSQSRRGPRELRRLVAFRLLTARSTAGRLV
jgi:hypothetical protein